MNFGKIMILGDSYSTYEGFVPSGNAVYYLSDRNARPADHPYVSSPSKTWWGRVMDATNSTLALNDSWSGSTICNTGYGGADCSQTSSFVHRFDRLLKSGFFERSGVNTAFVFGGTNDGWASSPLGEIPSDEELENLPESELFRFVPAVFYLAKRFRENLPAVRTIFIANCDVKPEIVSAISAACERFNHDFVELKNVDKFGGHPTELGMEQICSQILAATK